MDKPTLRDAIKHPEKMGPLGDKPERPRRVAKGRPPEAQPARQQAWTADREQFTTSE